MIRPTTRPNAAPHETVMEVAHLGPEHLGAVVRPHALTLSGFEPGRLQEIVHSPSQPGTVSYRPGAYMVLVLSGTDPIARHVANVPLKNDELIVVTEEYPCLT